MAEYIDKKQAIDRIASCYCIDCEHSNGILCRACEHQDDMDLIDEIPAADVQPAKHGRWIMHSDYPDKIICSHCNSARDVYFCERDSMKYCPNCGARMEEG